jgi:hypothetical protein
MGMPVGRIEKEFVFKVLVDEGAECDVHGSQKEARCRFAAAGEDLLDLAPVEGELPLFPPGEELRVFFYLKNNYHTFLTTVHEADGKHLSVRRPEGVYKNLQRKYERVRPHGDIEVSFTLSGRRIELNFPKTERFSPVEPPETSAEFDPHRIQELVSAFRRKMDTLCSANTITMLRDKLPRAWDDKVVTRLGKSLWIPSTEEDFPARDPFPDERIITRADLVRLEEESGAAPYVISGRLGNILYEKAQKKDIFSELFCPILYNEYAVGIIHAWNTGGRRERIAKPVVEYVQQFARVLSYSLVRNGYFRAEAAAERRYEAPIIDMSASGLLFAHTNADLGRELLVHTDLDLVMRLEGKPLQIGARIMRKFKDADSVYFGALFLRITPEDFAFLFKFLYGKPFDPAYENTWEGGAPPPPVEL